MTVNDSKWHLVNDSKWHLVNDSKWYLSRELILTSLFVGYSFVFLYI